MLVKSLQWNRKIQCGHSCGRMLPLFELFGAYFLFIWYENVVPTPLFIALHTCLQHERERPDMERKYMNSDNAQWKDPKLTTLVCSGWRHKYTKQASSRSAIYIVIEDSGWAREPVSGVATALLKTPRTQLKNRQKWHSLDICLKHIQNHNFSWSRTQK